MKPIKEEKSEILFRELGNVSDRYLAEAVQYRHSGTPWVTISAVAAGLLLAIGVFLGARLMLGNILTPGKNDGSGADIGSRIEEVLRAGQCTPLAVGSDGHVTPNGEAYLVWQSAEDETYYRSRTITDAEKNRLCDALKRSGTTVSSMTREEPTFRIWLVLADGEVLTPYLPLTAGNVGLSTLFDYGAEQIPPQAFLEAVCAVFGENP